MSYDKNGNILTLLRNGHLDENVSQFGIMDNLSYSYDNGNKLLSVSDGSGRNTGFKDVAGTDYTYDINGNMISDSNKEISSISYNHLNLPTNVSSISHYASINYTYDATGTKLKKYVSGMSISATTTEYTGNYIYENGTLQFINQPEGYIKFENGNFEYVYQYRDHLGNVRLSYSDNNSDGVITVSGNPNTNEIIDENHFYPFGLKHTGYNYHGSNNGNSVAQKRTYNGKEFQDELNLNWYDYGARNYQADLGRWMNLDPVAEFYLEKSPYNYANNNPVLYIDPNGMWTVNIVSTTDSNGNVSYSLSFTAQAGDNLESLSKQLGISVEEILLAHPELKNSISEGNTYGLGNIDYIQNINNTINTIATPKNQKNWNCANLAAGECSNIKTQWDNPGNNNIEDFAEELFGSNYSNVEEWDTRIGTVVHYKVSKTSARQSIIKRIKKDMKAAGKTDSEIYTYLKRSDVQQLITNQTLVLMNGERHFTIVILKNADGTEVQRIIQKSGKSPFSLKVDDAKDVGNEIPYVPTQIYGAGTPYFNKNKQE